MVWARLGLSTGVATHGGSVWGLPLGQGWPSLSLPEGIFCSFCWWWGPQGHWVWLFPGHTMLGDRVNTVEEVCCSHSRASYRWWFRAMVMSQWSSVVSAREWVSAGVVVGAWMAVAVLSGCTQPGSTSRNCGSQKGSLGVPVSQRAALGKWTAGPLSPHLSPLGTLPSPCAATACIFAADGASYGHLHWACHLSWHWCAFCSIEAHGSWHLALCLGLWKSQETCRENTVCR